MSMSTCPTCGAKEGSRGLFETEGAVKIHHKKTHGESLAFIELECYWCGVTFRRYESLTPYNDRNFCSQECHHEWRKKDWDPPSIGHPPNYIDGRGRYRYYGKNWRRRREEVIARDHVCQSCGHDGSERLLDVHHIEPLRKFESPEEANKMDNLILLCRTCHGIAERMEEDW